MCDRQYFTSSRTVWTQKFLDGFFPRFFSFHFKAPFAFAWIENKQICKLQKGKFEIEGWNKNTYKSIEIKIFFHVYGSPIAVGKLVHWWLQSFLGTPTDLQITERWKMMILRKTNGFIVGGIWKISTKKWIHFGFESIYSQICFVFVSNPAGCVDLQARKLERSQLTFNKSIEQGQASLIWVLRLKFFSISGQWILSQAKLVRTKSFFSCPTAHILKDTFDRISFQFGPRSIKGSAQLVS